MGLKRGTWWRLSIVLLALPLGIVYLGRLQAQSGISQAVAAPEASIVAAAPGWVDVQGGTRHLSAKTDGIVAEVLAISDAPVPAGTVLLRLDDQTLRLEQKANALDIQRNMNTEKSLAEQLRQAQEETSRLKTLVKIKAEPAEILRQAQAQVRRLETDLQAARLDVQSSRVKQEQLAMQLEAHLMHAPSSGRVLRRYVYPGDALRRGIPVIWFAPDAPLIVRAELDERLFARVRVGMSAEVQAESGDGHVFQARVVRIAQAVGPVRALPEIKATAKDDRVIECILSLSESDLLIGQRVTVSILRAP